MPRPNKVAAPPSTSVRAQGKRRTRESILDAAAAAFTELGYNATSLRDIAARAGLSHTGLLHHFPDKPALLEAVLDDRLDGPAKTLPLDSHDGATFISALIDLAERDASNPSNVALLTVLSAEAVAPDHPAHDYFKQWHAEVRQRVSNAFSDLQSKGRYHAVVPPDLAALHVSAMRDGVHLQWLVAPDEIELAEVIRSQFEVYVDLST